MKNRGTPPLYVVGTDGSAPSDEAVDYAANLAKRDGARLFIVAVQRLDPWARAPRGAWIGSPPASIEAAAKQSEGILARAKERAGRLGVEADVETFPPQEPAPALVQFAESEGASLLVVGSRGLTGIRRVLLGSVAQQVVRLAHCPVVVVR